MSLIEHGIEIGAGLGPAAAGRIWRIGLMGANASRAVADRVLAALDAVPATADAGASVGALLEKGQKSVTIETIVAEVRHPMLALRTQIGAFPAPETGGDVGAADAGLPPVVGRAVAT